MCNVTARRPRSHSWSQIAPLLQIALALATTSFSVSGALAAPTQGDELYAGPASLGKVSRKLLEAGSAGGPSPAGAAAPRSGNIKVEVDIRLRRLDPAIEARIRDLGASIANADYDHARVSAHCSPEALPAISALPEVTAIHPNYGSQTMTGEVTSQADVSIGAAAARSDFGVDGTGVRVGILSDTFNRSARGTLIGSGCDRVLVDSRPQIDGEIPERIVFLDAGPGGGSDEGRAMAELIFDLAPGAGQMFHSAFPTISDFARGIDALADCEADIIVDDVIFFAEPMFQDGIIAQAAQRAVDGGIPFFSALGNLGTFGVDEMYTDFSETDDNEPFPSGNDLHVFSNGSRFAAIDLPPRCGVRLVLQWNEPFSGVLGEGATSDLDIYACTGANPANCQSGASSRDPQGCSVGAAELPAGDPLEIMRVRNATNVTQTTHIAVEHVCGNKDLHFRIAIFADGCNYPSTYEFDDVVFNKAQGYGHPAAAGVVATAAVFYQEIDTDGAHTAPDDRIDVEAFSSLGGNIPIYFDHMGNPLPNPPELRSKPELTGPDGTNTSFFGLRDEEGDGYRNFFGTSAAAPHVAAVAALMLEVDPSLTPPRILSILQETATDIEDPGHDFLSGYGLVDAYAAVAAVATNQPSPTPTPTATYTPTPSATPSFTSTSTETPSITPSAAPSDTPRPCPGDCDSDSAVIVAELVRGVRIVLGLMDLAVCLPLDSNGDGNALIEDLVGAVGASLDGCPA
jgi:subtilisin family serine protease